MRRLAIFVPFLLAGCGGGNISAPSTAPVRGTVTFKGKPIADVRVTFHPQFDMGSIPFRPNGTTGQDGTFTLSTAKSGDGAPPGEYAVTFELIRVESDRKSSGIETEVDAWKGKHNDPAKGVKVTVRKGENQLEPFKLD